MSVRADMMVSPLLVISRMYFWMSGLYRKGVDGEWRVEWGVRARSLGAGHWAEGLVEGVVELGDPSASLRAGSPPLFGRLRAVVGFGGWVGVGVGVGSGWLLGAFAETSVEEDSGCGYAVVVGGVFVYALSDVVEHVDDFAGIVGFGEDGVGEI